MLTPEQMAHFHTFGYVVLRQHFTLDEITIMQRESDEIYEEDRDGRPFDGEETQYVQPFFERKPFLSVLLDDDRIYDIGVDLLGPDFMLVGTEGRLRVGPTPWHGGLPSADALRTVKINIYPDALTKETGALRVIPGSHHIASPDLWEPLRTLNYSPDFRPFDMAPQDVPCVPLEVEPGDVVLFQEYTLHSSFGGAETGRNQISTSFYADPKSEEEVREITDLHNRAHWSAHPTESNINSDRPRIRRMVSRLVELGFEHLPV